MRSDYFVKYIKIYQNKKGIYFSSIVLVFVEVVRDDILIIVGGIIFIFVNI